MKVRRIEIYEETDNPPLLAFFSSPISFYAKWNALDRHLPMFTEKLIMLLKRRSADAGSTPEKHSSDETRRILSVLNSQIENNLPYVAAIETFSRENIDTWSFHSRSAATFPRIISNVFPLKKKVKNAFHDCMFDVTFRTPEGRGWGAIGARFSRRRRDIRSPVVR